MENIVHPNDYWDENDDILHQSISEQNIERIMFEN